MSFEIGIVFQMFQLVQVPTLWYGFVKTSNSVDQVRVAE